jgi:hypothetical protein
MITFLLDTGARRGEVAGLRVTDIDFDLDVALVLLDAYPTPESAVRLGEARLAAFCRRHSDRGGRSPAELLGRLRAAHSPGRARFGGAHRAGRRPGPAAAHPAGHHRRP